MHKMVMVTSNLKQTSFSHLKVWTFGQWWQLGFRVLMGGCFTLMNIETLNILVMKPIWLDAN